MFHWLKIIDAWNLHQEMTIEIEKSIEEEDIKEKLPKSVHSRKQLTDSLKTIKLGDYNELLRIFKNIDKIKRLIRKVSKSIKDTLVNLGKTASEVLRLRWTRFHMIAYEGKRDLLKSQLENQLANPNLKGFSDLTPLHIAAMKGYPQVCKTFLENNAKCNSKCNVDKNCEKFITAVARKTGIVIYRDDLNNLTPLKLALIMGNTSSVKAILKFNSDREDLKSCLDTLCIKMQPLSETISDSKKLLIDKICSWLREDHMEKDLKIIPSYCSDNKSRMVFMAYSEKIFQKEQGQICGIDVYFQNPYILDNEAKIVNTAAQKFRFSGNQRKTIKNAINEYGYLFALHSNLNIISACPLKSKQGGKIVRKSTCIVFYVTTKRKIPIEEKKLPPFLKVGGKRLSTDVREGFFQLGPGRGTPTKHGMGWNNPLLIGGSTGQEGVLSSGTVGPFAECKRNRKFGYLTCAHVFGLFQNYNFNSRRRIKAVQPSPEETEYPFLRPDQAECGHVLRACFDASMSPSIDAAIVEVTNQTRIPQQGHFAVSSNSQCTDCGFNEDPVFNTGKFVKEITDDLTDKCLIKSGRTTGLTRGAFRVEGAQVRSNPDAFIGGLPNSSNQQIVLNNQYEINDIGRQEFFRAGDSGSGVFFKDAGGPNLTCVGLAIGSSTHFTTIVTPIEPILQALNVQLKPFPVGAVNPSMEH